MERTGRGSSFWQVSREMSWRKILITNVLRLVFKDRRNSLFVNGNDLVERRKLALDIGVGLSAFEMGGKVMSRVINAGK